MAASSSTTNSSTSSATALHHYRGLNSCRLVWDANADPFSNVVSVTMTRLRRKLGEPPLIETVVGRGYRM